MALTQEQQTALANEARRQELKQRVARLKGFIDAVTQFNNSAAPVINDVAVKINAAQADLTALDEGEGQGLTVDYGAYSTIEQSMRAERFAGKAAAIDYVKSNPECSLNDAVGAYVVVAMQTRPPDRQYLLQDPTSLLTEYRLNAVALGAIPAESGWEGFRQLVYATPKEVLMGM
jgi:hypothetical protein